MTKHYRFAWAAEFRAVCVTRGLVLTRKEILRATVHRQVGVPPRYAVERILLARRNRQAVAA